MPTEVIVKQGGKQKFAASELERTLHAAQNRRSTQFAWLLGEDPSLQYPKAVPSGALSINLVFNRPEWSRQVRNLAVSAIPVQPR